MGFEDDLKARRAGIEAEIAGLQARVAQLESVLSSFDDIIRFYDPSVTVAVPALAKGKRAALPLPPPVGGSRLGWSGAGRLRLLPDQVRRGIALPVAAKVPRRRLVQRQREKRVGLPVVGP